MQGEQYLGGQKLGETKLRRDNSRGDYSWGVYLFCILIGWRRHVMILWNKHKTCRNFKVRWRHLILRKKCITWRSLKSLWSLGWLSCYLLCNILLMWGNWRDEGQSILLTVSSSILIVDIYV